MEGFESMSVARLVNQTEGGERCLLSSRGS
jgi:hypothetical protein